MAVGVQVDYRGVTLEQYDEIVEIIGLLPGGPPPPGVLFHCVTKTDDGIRVIDVWESREALQAFQTAVIGPLFSQVDVHDPPETTFFELHRYYLASRRSKG
jgi:hypothetical protein